MSSILKINDHCLNLIFTYLDTQSAKDCFSLLKRIDPKRAASFLERHEHWVVRLALDPTVQIKIQAAALFPRLQIESLALTKQVRKESFLPWPLSVLHQYIHS